MEEEIEDMIFGDENMLKELLEKQTNGELEDGFDFDFPRYSEIFGTGFRWDVPYKVADLNKFREVTKEMYGYKPCGYEGGYLSFSPNIYCCSSYSRPNLGFHIWGKDDYHECLTSREYITLDEYKDIMKRLVSTLGEVDKEALDEKIRGHEQEISEQTKYLNILRSL